MYIWQNWGHCDFYHFCLDVFLLLEIYQALKMRIVKCASSFLRELFLKYRNSIQLANYEKLSGGH